MVEAAPPKSLPAEADDDERLVELARAGDMLAFEELVERHRLLVFRVTARIVGPDEADDVTQDAFLRAFHRLDRFRGDAPFRVWLLRIAHNAALDALDRRRETPIGASGADFEPDETTAQRGSASPAESLEESERRDRLALKIAGLRPEHATVLVLRDLEGLTYEEIAEITRTPLGSVKGRLHRARRELIDLLRANTYDWELPE